MEKEFSSEKWILQELSPNLDDLIFKDCWKAVKTWKVINNQFGGYTENELSFHLMKDGGMILWDDDEMISITKEQMEVLKDLIKLQK